MSKHRPANALIHASSPYLLQHAYNPVNWHAWDESVLDKAIQEDKLLLISIGYSACHWCHVMAHECFEDEEVARIMNEHFICIKVDREERPDVDHFFMTAVHLMGIQGGWPLNVVALPDGQPFWGGTYFPKTQWMEVLLKITTLFSTDRDKVSHHAHNLTTGIQQASIITTPGMPDQDISEIITEAMEVWSPLWDIKWGGSLGKPKFPMPVNLKYLMHLHFYNPQETFINFTETSLDRMSMGGIYDQVGGGFARYSVDETWKVPHFEKMLYDNAQLTELYSDAFSVLKKEAYREVVHETIDFVERELMHHSGAFYSALDADSEGVEGKYYVWTQDELKKILGDDFPLFADYFNINETGYWEDNQYILMRTQSNDAFAVRHNIDRKTLNEKVASWKHQLFEKRKQRVKPGLDDKSVTSWNALMNKGLSQAFKAFGDEKFRKMALKNGHFLAKHTMGANGSLCHTWKKGRPSEKGFMEDYAAVAEAFIALYEISGDEDWIQRSIRITNYAVEHFYDKEMTHFRFMEKAQKDLPANHYETQDNVIPSANSTMGFALTKLSLLTGNATYAKMAHEMLETMLPEFRKYPWGYANWGSLMLFVYKPKYEVVVCGPEVDFMLKEMQSQYRPNVVWAKLTPDSAGEISIVQNRKVQDQPIIYVCSQGTCRMPVHSVSEAERLFIA